ncbi:MAG: amidoligase family protein [Bacillota bacterium]
MPVLREDLISRLRRLAAQNRSSSREALDAATLTSGPFEVVSDNGAVLQVDISESRNYVSTNTGNIHTVENGGCSCPDYQINGTCIHVQAVELVHTGSTGPETEETVTVNNISPDTPRINNARAREAEKERRQRRTRLEAWQKKYGDDIMLTRNDEAFNRLHKAVKSGNAVQYEYENVLAGSENTFGIEIEFVSGNLHKIAHSLHGLGLGDGQIHSYHSQRQPGKWTVETDSSVSIGYRGGEVISPVLKDCPETWKQLEKVCEVIKRYGGRINSKCGGHIHICADPLDARSFRWNRLMKIWGGYEDVLYRMASGGQSNGQFRGRTYAGPIASTLPAMFLRDRQTDETEIRRHAGNRYQGLNFLNANPGTSKNTVEFRLWNGSLNPKQIQANIKTSMAIIHASELVRRTEESTRERGEMIPVSQTMPYGDAARTGKDPDDHTEIKRLLDILFVRSKDKAAALWLYASSQWQR